MNLSEVTGEFKNVRAITYNAKGDKAVYHNRMMRYVSGNIYSGVGEADEYGSVYCSVYVKYPDVDVALYLSKLSATRDIVSVERIVAESGFDTGEAFIDKMNKLIESNGYIRLTEIELIKHIAPELESAAWESRRIYSEEREKRDAKRREEREAEETIYVERENNIAFDLVQNAIGVLKNGGTVANENVTFYNTRYDYKTYSLINYLMDANGIALPMRTRGWIKNSLKSVRISSDGRLSWSFWKKGNGKGSSSFPDYMLKLINAVKV